MKLKIFSQTWILYGLFAFPSFYFVYKYGSPDFGLRDFYDYYKLYKDWDIDHVDAPFNMRLLSSFFVYLFNKAGLHYETATAFDKIQGYDKQVFFNAVLFNFLCVISTCTMIFTTLKKHFNDLLLAFSGGLVYLLGFGTLFYELMPITDALSVLLFAITLHFYISKSNLVIIPLLLLIIQREYVFLALGLMALLDYWKQRNTYYTRVLLCCIACFAIYFILRKTMFYTPKYDRQASLSYFLHSIIRIKFSLGPYIRQTLMTINIFVIYLMVILYKWVKRLEFDKFELAKLGFLFLQINIISFAAVFGNNTGRYFYILIPLVIFQLVKETQPLLKGKESA